MAQISMNNGVSFVAVSELTGAQVLLAVDVITAKSDDPIYEEVDDLMHTSTRAWLAAYCDAHERNYGTPFVVG